MPISLLPTNRRQFLASTAAGGAALSVASLGQIVSGAEEKPVDPARFALLADTHIPADPSRVLRGVNMAENLRGVVAQLVKLATNPAAAIVVGDCAVLEGKTGDYQQLRDLLAPLSKAGLPIHLALGNHDDRNNCGAAFPAADGSLQARVERRVAVVPGEHANWFLLDSLDKVNYTPGKLGSAQLQWLAEALDTHRDRPALICVHHDPAITSEKPAGLTDSEPFLKMAADRKWVKAIFYGHTHAWSVTNHEGLHLVNLPPVAYVFAEGQPSGWVEAALGPTGIELKLLCHDTKHRRHGEVASLEWRA
jgi:Icc protein